MDPWQMFSEMCRLVVETQSAFLQVTIIDNAVRMELFPAEDLEGDEDE